VVIKWAWREIRNNKKFVFLFILNLSIGLTGFLVLDAFKAALSKATQENAKNFLSADVAVSIRRRLAENEIQAIDKVIEGRGEKGKNLEFFSMAVSSSTSRLVQVKAIDQTYPYYGHLGLEGGEKITATSAKSLVNLPVVWVYPELLNQLGVKVGDKLKLGEGEFTIEKLVIDDSTQTFRLASLAPKVYVGIESLAQTGLLKLGTTLSETVLIRLNNESDQEKVVAELKAALTDVGIRVTTYQEAGEDSARALSYLSDYLGLVSLVALFLAGLGSAYLFRSFIFARLKAIAIYNTLGLERSQAQLVYFVQLMMLGLASALISYLISTSLLPVMTNLMNQLSPLQVQAGVSFKTLFLAILISSASTILIGWPFLRPLRFLALSQLFQEDSNFVQGGKTLWTSFLPALGFYWVMAVWQANSIRVGSSFFGLFIASLILLVIIGYGILTLTSRLKISKPWFLKHSLLTLSRRKASSLSAIVAVGLGALLINLMPQLKAGLEQELLAPTNISLPSLFLFDIQDDQVEPVKSFLKEKEIPLQYLSPMVRGRILKVNEESFERQAVSGFATREEEQAARFRNRGVNLSYRPELSNSEVITEGKFYSGSAKEGELGELSVEEGYGEDLNFKLEDVLTFDIQGVEIQGRITSFRKVKWNSFQPNFFILIQPGVLEEAPKTFLAGIPKLSDEKVEMLQSEMGRKFGNISAINVSRLVEKVFEISDRMSWSLELMAWLSFLSGFVVLGSLAHHQALSRRWDLNMQKILGAAVAENQKMILIEFALVGLVASVLGAGLSILMGFVLSEIMFGGGFRLQWETPVLTVVGVIGVSVMIALLVFRSVIAEKPIVFLQAGRQDLA
jgi:putative ABC transport system permease protein